MDILTLALLIAIGSYIANHQQQRKRIALLASHLGHYQIEKLMEALTEGYLRALGESTPERRDQIWSLLTTTESQLSEQFNRFAAEFAQVNEADARVSRFAMAIPFASQLFPGTTFDMRKALAIHAPGHRKHGPQRGPAGPARQGLHDVGRAVPDAAHLPLVLQIENHRHGAHAGAAQDAARAAGRFGVAANPQRLSGVGQGRQGRQGRVTPFAL